MAAVRAPPDDNGGLSDVAACDWLITTALDDGGIGIVSKETRMGKRGRTRRNGGGPWGLR